MRKTGETWAEGGQLKLTRRFWWKKKKTFELKGNRPVKGLLGKQKGFE